MGRVMLLSGQRLLGTDAWHLLRLDGVGLIQGPQHQLPGVSSQSVSHRPHDSSDLRDSSAWGPH